MSVRTLKDIGSDFIIPEPIDAAVYSLITEDCIIKGVGDEFEMIYSSDSLQVSFNAGSQAIVEGNAFWLPETESITLPSNSTFNLVLRIDTTQPYGSTGSIVALTDAEIQSSNINNSDGAIRDLIIYKITTDTNGVTSATDVRTIRDGDSVKGITGILPTLTVHAKSKTIITAKCNGDTINATASDDKIATLYLTQKGLWTITNEDVSKQIEIVDCGNYDINFLGTIMGCYHDMNNSDPACIRTDEAEGLTFTATVGNVTGHSDFDDMPIYKDIAKEILSTGDYMVKIPKFWFKRYTEDSKRYIKVTDIATEGFTLHPAFNRLDGIKDYIYVAAYETSSNNKSLPNATVTVNQTRATMRSNAKAKGAGWGLIDLAALSAVEMLMTIEIANLNVQSVIGEGYSSSGHSAAIQTGKCDGVANLTGRPAGTSNDVAVVWRGIENFWGNIWEWFDGLNINNGIYYICNDISKYADDTSNGYTALNYQGLTGWSGSYITLMGLDEDNAAYILPTAAGSGSASNYFCDGCWSSTGWRVAKRGGGWYDGSLDGLWYVNVGDASSYTDSGSGSRLLYIPS